MPWYFLDYPTTLETEIRKIHVLWADFAKSMDINVTNDMVFILLNWFLAMAGGCRLVFCASVIAVRNSKEHWHLAPIGIPNTLVSAYNVLTTWKDNRRFAVRVVGGAKDGMAFVNVDDNASATSDMALTTKGTKKSFTGSCFRFGKKGHMQNDYQLPYGRRDGR